ncbi:MAG: hypothetical protein HYV97_14770 [Bdellovibrio sp.]|nr:hypothetical protein [Bdellovibrio sp.]
MLKFIILIFVCSAVYVFAKELASSGLINQAFVSAPVYDGNSSTEKSEGRYFAPLKDAGRALSQMLNDTESYGKSYTGLTSEEEETILSNIDTSRLERNEDDTIWTTISNAYVKSYSKLFRNRN